MRAYNVEIFTRNFEFIDHTTLSDISCDLDYIAPGSNSIYVENITAHLGDYIRITNGTLEIFGFVTGTTQDTKDMVTLTYESFLSLFNCDWLFNVKTQGNEQSLEEYIALTIHSQHSYNTDTYMNLPQIVTNITSTTSKWSLGLKSDQEGSDYCIINFLKNIIIPAFEKYSVRIDVHPDIATKTINLTIGTNNDSVKTIETDLPNIIKKNITLRSEKNVVNKVVVFNDENWTDTAIYYRHPDDTFDQRNEDRLTPVVQVIRTAQPVYEDEEIISTFEEEAFYVAEDEYASIEYDNLIEVTMAMDDELYLPLEYGIGQVAKIIIGEKEYTSIMSGFSIDKAITLIFGLIRVDLTKRIRRSTYGY